MLLLSDPSEHIVHCRRHLDCCHDVVRARCSRSAAEASIASLGPLQRAVRRSLAPATFSRPFRLGATVAPLRLKQSLNDLIRPTQCRLGDREAKGLGGFEVDHEVEPVELLDWQLSGVGAQQNALNELGRQSADSVIAQAIAR